MNRIKFTVNGFVLKLPMYLQDNDICTPVMDILWLNTSFYFALNFAVIQHNI